MLLSCKSCKIPNPVRTEMIIKGPYPDVSIPETALTPFVLHRAQELGDKPALIDGPTGRTFTYQQVADSISIVAHNLSERGFRKGDVCGILSPNCPEYGIAFHAVATLGGIVTPINPLYTRYEVGHQLKDSGARFLITVPDCAEKVLEADNKAGLDELIVFGSLPGATSFDELLVETVGIVVHLVGRDHEGWRAGRIGRVGLEQLCSRDGRIAQ